MELVGSPKTSVRNYHLMLHNTSEEQRFHLTIWWCRPLFGCSWFSSE